MKETKTNNAPAAIGPYSQAITVGNMLFTSGQIPINPATGDIPEGVEAQAEQALTNVKNLIEAAGGSIENVVKTTVFIKDMNDFAKINERSLLLSERSFCFFLEFPSQWYVLFHLRTVPGGTSSFLAISTSFIPS